MERAGIFIGVDHTGKLQQLNDAAAGARRMYEWALSQGMPAGTHAKLITDDGGRKVKPDSITDAIQEIIDGPGVEQLIVYFAGHGVIINRCEQWLLSEAPVKAYAAVNVDGSGELARYCGIPHVVMISDACRVAPEGIQAQSVRGVDVFPNQPTGGKAKPVDMFFACVPGSTSVEIKDPAQAAGCFSALYTSALLDGLEGREPDALEPVGDPLEMPRYVRPVRLQAYLSREVRDRIVAMNLQHKVHQDPDAVINSEAHATTQPNWLSRLKILPRGSVARAPRGTVAAPKTLSALSKDLVQSAINRPVDFERALAEVRSVSQAGADRLAGLTRQVAAPFGPEHFETNCGIKVRGARLKSFFTVRAKGELLGSGADVLRIELRQPAASVLLGFEDGSGTVIPAIDGFIAGITVENGAIVDISYEPSTNNWRWQEYVTRAPEVRALRAAAATATNHGRFRLTDADAEAVAIRMQFSKGVDPSLAVYAAYAYHDLQLVEHIRDMARYMRDGIGVVLFDVALLGKELTGQSAKPERGIVPFVPLLSQGWALLRANRVQLHSALGSIDHHLRESVWSLFDEQGLRLLTRALESKEVA